MYHWQVPSPWPPKLVQSSRGWRHCQGSHTHVGASCIAWRWGLGWHCQGSWCPAIFWSPHNGRGWTQSQRGWRMMQSTLLSLHHTIEGHWWFQSWWKPQEATFLQHPTWPNAHSQAQLEHTTSSSLGPQQAPEGQIRCHQEDYHHHHTTPVNNYQSIFRIGYAQNLVQLQIKVLYNDWN